MRVFLLTVFCLTLSPVLYAADGAADLFAQLLKNLGAAEATALKQKPPDTDKAAILRRAADLVHSSLSPSHSANVVRNRNDEYLSQLQGLLADFPDLVKLAEQWKKAQEEEDLQWQKDTCQEIEKLLSDVAAKLRTVQEAGDLDEPHARMAALVAKYPFIRGDGDWPASMNCVNQVREMQLFVSYFQAALLYQKSGQRHEALNSLHNLFECESRPYLASLGLRPLIDAQAERLGLPSTDHAEEAMRGVIVRAIAASKPAELDPLLDETNRERTLWTSVASRETGVRNPVMVADLAREFVVKWQDFLVQRASGDIARARQTVEALARTAEAEPVYPRSQLLEAAAALKDIPAAPPMASPSRRTTATISVSGDGTVTRSVSTDPAAPADKPTSPAQNDLLAGVKSLDDLAAQLPGLKGAEKLSFEDRVMVSELERIQGAYAALRGGDLQRVKIGTFGGLDKNPKVAELRNELTVRLVATALRSEGALAPNAGEQLEKYIPRLIADAQQRKDWNRLKVILEAAQQYAPFHKIVDPVDGSALREFLTGRNLDTGGIWSSAVASYVRVLKTGSSIVPVDEIKQRLEAIRREHPDDYKRGNEQAAAPTR